jgi:hypothetical protein
MSDHNGNGQAGDNRHGGNRRGSGRPKGARNRRTVAAVAVAEQAKAEGSEPLDVMLRCMRGHEAAGEMDRAAEVARWAAPYLHPKFSSVAVSATVGPAPVPITFIEVAPPAESPPERDGGGG